MYLTLLYTCISRSRQKYTIFSLRRFLILKTIYMQNVILEKPESCQNTQVYYIEPPVFLRRKHISVDRVMFVCLFVLGFNASLTLRPPSTTIVPYANSFDQNETASNSPSHLDQSCLTLRQHFHHL